VAKATPCPPAYPPEALARIAQRLKALADPTRLQILQMLGSRERCVSDLVARVGGTQATVSKHLAVLRAAGLVRPRRDGMNVYYAVEDAAALEVCQLMCGCVEREASRAIAEVAPASGAAVGALTGTAGTSAARPR